ncbi:MAG: hypothetical protein WCH11_03455, partial [Bdellovibrio sp.]
MGESFFHQRSWLFWGLAGLAMLLGFQNCGPSGMGTTDQASVDGSVVNSKFAGAPLPIEMNFNQIAFMSCPAPADSSAGLNAVSDPDPLSNPYFTIRAGGFDNSSFVELKGPSGGVGISPAGLSYIKSAISESATPQSQVYFIRSSPRTNNKIPTVAILNRARSKEVPSPVQPAYTVSFLDTLSNQFVAQTLSQGSRADGKSMPASFFSQIAAGRRSFVVDYVAPTPQVVEDIIQGRLLNSNSFFFLGLVDRNLVGQSEQAIRGFAGPDKDFTRRIFGRGYSFRFSNSARSAPGECSGGRYIPCLASGSEGSLASSVREWDLNPDLANNSVAADPVDLTQRNRQVWRCENLLVVRHIDRYYYKARVAFTNQALKPGSPIVFNASVGSVLPKQFRPEAAKAERFYFTNEEEVRNIENAITYSNEALFQPGRWAACPPPSMADLEPSDPKKAMEMRERMQMVRRFLPADLWEVNLNQKCVVPTKKVEDSGARCYAQGEVNVDSYVRYKLTDTSSCGSNKDECPASVSICYRTEKGTSPTTVEE